MISRRGFLQIFGLGAGASLLSACGFRLRGTGEMAQAGYKSVFLVDLDKAPAELRNRLQQQFSALGIEVVDSLAAAEVSLQFGRYHRAISRTSYSNLGETTSELLTLTQDVMAFRVADEVEVLNTQVMAMRDRQIDPNNRMAGARELQMIERQMMQDLSYQIIDQLNRAYVLLMKEQPLEDQNSAATRSGSDDEISNDSDTGK